jgi:hypothetical protein
VVEKLVIEGTSLKKGTVHETALRSVAIAGEAEESFVEEVVAVQVPLWKVQNRIYRVTGVRCGKGRYMNFWVVRALSVGSLCCW